MYGMRLKTKQQRLDLQKYTFESLIKSGYTQEIYKNLFIFTKDEPGFYLKVYSGTSTNHIIYTRYRTAEQRAQVIQNAKDSHDRQEVRKAEAKANPTKSTAANCAGAIKEELKAKFPGVKFSVKSSNFSGGNSVHINWTDGPTTDEVDAITKRYQYGHFDGMTDMYEYSNNIEGLPQAKYVQTSRDMSAETRAAMLPMAEAMYEDWKDHHGIHRAGDIVYRVFNRYSIPVGATVTGIERTECTCGHLEEFYRIAYTLPEQETRPAPVEVPAGQIQVIEYSEKAIAVIGDTRSIKDKLKELGGRFNFRLTCGPGWIFPKSKLTELQTALTA